MDGTGLLVVAGGRSRRWGGVDKTAHPLGGRPVLLHTLFGAVDSLEAAEPDVAGHRPVVVVAPADHPARAEAEARLPRVGWTLEAPPGTGPAAGVAAGLDLLVQTAPRARRVVMLAADMPFAATAVPRLLAALGPAGGSGPDAAVAVDPDGVPQYLMAACRIDALVGAMAAAPVEGAAMRAVLAPLTAVEVPVSAREGFDLDTPDRLPRAAELLDRSRDA